MKKFEIMETKSPASADQLNDKLLEGLELKFILPFDGMLYYHFIQL